jgi:putative effector of murein hydrolase
MEMDFLREFWLYLKRRKKFWLAPLLISMVLFGALLVLTQGSAVAPFIYTLF